MCLDHAKQQSLAKQQVMFCQIEKDTLWTHADIARMLDCHPNTVSGWALGKSEMSFGAFRELCRFVDDKHTSLMLEPIGKHVATDTHDEDEGDIDELYEAASNVVTTIGRARMKKSPGGPAIVHTERLQIQDVTRDMIAKGRRVVRLEKVA